jgi:cold shock protein
MNGKVKFYNQEKGFGFITADDGNDYFVHQSGLNGDIILRENDAVTFDVTEGDRGPKAVNVSLAGASEEAETESDEVAAE